MSELDKNKKNNALRQALQGKGDPYSTNFLERDEERIKKVKPAGKSSNYNYRDYTDKDTWGK